MRDEEKLDRSGAFDYEELVDEERPAPSQDIGNPAGITRGDCDTAAADEDDTCDHEITAHVDDLFMEETKPGYGILGYEGEESGGG